MKYLIFGDVHGNLPALEKMLAIEKGNFDQLICHGDVVNYGPWSNECVELINTIVNSVRLKGNHEENYIIGSYTGTNVVAQSFFNFCYPRFDRIEDIINYGEKKELKNFTVQHTIDNSYLFPDSDLSKFNLDKNYIIGHSHHQFDRHHGNFQIVNTGSIGQNRKHINIANYILLNEEKNEVLLKSFTYDVESVIQEMVAQNYPEICINYYKNKSRA